MKNDRPFVFSNFAMTADGKIAFASDHFVPFSSSLDREHMMELRATADAVISGARTVEPEGVKLGPGGARYRRLRRRRGLSEYNLRVIASGSGSVDPDADIFKHRFSPIIVLTSRRAPQKNLAVLRTVADDVAVFGRDQIDFRAAFRWLRRKWKIRRLLCEGGGELHGALVCADLVDELHLTVCPVIFGGKHTPTMADGVGLRKLADARQFELKSFKRVENEVFTVWKRPASQ
jgi:2,5-diamino-6-(ribosylamino)-4(3H)-pyrimidinone 5'-phosphate reductase